MFMRTISQISTLFIHVVILAGVFWSYKKRPDKMYKLIPQLLFGLSGVLFYVWVLFTGQDLSILSETRTDISSMRSLFQASLIAASIWMYRVDDVIALIKKRRTE